MALSDEINKLSDLKIKKIISDSEFESAKKKLLTDDTFSQIEKLLELKGKNIINDSEFKNFKERLLKGNNPLCEISYTCTTIHSSGTRFNIPCSMKIFKNLINDIKCPECYGTITKSQENKDGKIYIHEKIVMKEL